MAGINRIVGIEDEPRYGDIAYWIADPTHSHIPSLAGAQWDAGIAQTETVSAVLGSGAVCMVGPPPDTWRVVVGTPGATSTTAATKTDPQHSHVPSLADVRWDAGIAQETDAEALKAVIWHIQRKIAANNEKIAGLSSELFEARQALFREGVRQAVSDERIAELKAENERLKAASGPPFDPSEDAILSLATWLAAAHADTWFGNAKATTEWLRAARVAFDHAGYLPSIAAARADAARMRERMTVAGKRPAPLSASWHHLPCVTAGAVPPARAEEPIWRALLAKGDGVVR